jgi:hypothetical protein
MTQRVEIRTIFNRPKSFLKDSDYLGEMNTESSGSSPHFFAPSVEPSLDRTGRHDISGGKILALPNLATPPGAFGVGCECGDVRSSSVRQRS